MLLCKKYTYLLLIAIEYFILRIDTGGLKRRLVRDMDMPEKLSFDSRGLTDDTVVTTYLHTVDRQAES